MKKIIFSLLIAIASCLYSCNNAEDFPNYKDLEEIVAANPINSVINCEFVVKNNTLCLEQYLDFSGMYLAKGNVFFVPTLSESPDNFYSLGDVYNFQTLYSPSRYNRDILSTNSIRQWNGELENYKVDTKYYVQLLLVESCGDDMYKVIYCHPIQEVEYNYSPEMKIDNINFQGNSYGSYKLGYYEVKASYPNMFEKIAPNYINFVNIFTDPSEAVKVNQNIDTNSRIFFYSNSTFTYYYNANKEKCYFQPGEKYYFQYFWCEKLEDDNYFIKGVAPTVEATMEGKPFDAKLNISNFYSYTGNSYIVVFKVEGNNGNLISKNGYDNLYVDISPSESDLLKIGQMINSTSGLAQIGEEVSVYKDKNYNYIQEDKTYYAQLVWLNADGTSVAGVSPTVTFTPPVLPE